jgi:hypothetical protein
VYATDQYLGPVYPTHNYGFSTTIDLYRFQLSALAEGAGGHMALNNLPWQTARRDLWPECNDRQPLTEQTAIWRARCSQPLPDRESWIRPADYFKLRTFQGCRPRHSRCRCRTRGSGSGIRGSIRS